jgi:hypothetical protein
MVADPVRTLRSLPPVGELIINFPFRCCGAFHTLILESAASYSVRQTIRYSMGRLSSSIAYRDIPLRTDGVDGPIEARDAFPLVSPHTRRGAPNAPPLTPGNHPPDCRAIFIQLFGTNFQPQTQTGKTPRPRLPERELPRLPSARLALPPGP